MLKEKLGRVPITVLTDSLYANEPVIHLYEILGWQYMCVRQEESLKKVGRQCDELSKTELYQKSYQAKQVHKKTEIIIEQTIQWFNHVTIGNESFTNVLRFEEVSRNKKGKIVKKFKTEWLNAKTIHKGNCFKMAQRGRMRADHEDMYNTFKNRGFAAKHDYARTDPNPWLIWKLLMFVSFWIFEVFSFTQMAREAKGNRSWMKFIYFINLFAILNDKF